MSPNETHGSRQRHDPTADEQPSMRIRVAAAELRRGHDPVQIARSTGVPLALVQLLADDLRPDAQFHGDRAPSIAERPRSTVPQRRIALLSAGFIASTLNVLLAIAAVFGHVHILGAISLILTPVLLALLIALCCH
ncbi:hypothetical protein ACWDKQ_35145 [Saccharopolyspora sp. NPDC000995]